jgi:hypothetical protein
VIPDPLGRLPVGLRLWLATGLCVVPLGLVWSYRPGMFLPTPMLPGLCDDTTGYCTPDIPTAGIFTPGSTELVSQSPARVFLFAAFLMLAHVATRVRTAATRRTARLATGSLAVAALLAAAHGGTITFVCMAVALVAVAPPAWNPPAGAVRTRAAG